VFGTANAAVEGIPGRADQDAARSVDQGIAAGLYLGGTGGAGRDVTGSAGAIMGSAGTGYLAALRVSLAVLDGWWW